MGTLLQAGVAVYFNEPHVVVLINQKIVAQQLECFWDVGSHQLLPDAADCFQNYFGDFLLQTAEGQGTLGIFVLEIFYGIFKGKLIALAVLTVLLGLSLDGVVGQMYKFIIDIRFFIFFQNIFVLLAQLL